MSETEAQVESAEEAEQQSLDGGVSYHWKPVIPVSAMNQDFTRDVIWIEVMTEFATFKMPYNLITQMANGIEDILDKNGGVLPKESA